jgi:hypothetical protein
MEYFIVANTFAAPFVSDRCEAFEEAESPEAALLAYVNRFSHPARLFAAAVYQSATDYHKDKGPLATWLCNHEIAKRKAVQGKKRYSCVSLGPGRFKIDGDLIVVKNPFDGQIVPEAADGKAKEGK